ncbi:MAG: Ig-like domain-containing protein, partial [Granulosicoccaceae bacterium]
MIPLAMLSMPSIRIVPLLLCGLIAIHSQPVRAIETQRNCAIALNNDQFVVLSGYQGTVMDVLANDSGDIDSGSLVTVGQTTAAGGTVYVVDGKITYSPPSHFSGEDSFSYQVSETDWRGSGVSVPLQLSDAGAPPALTALGQSVVAAPSLGTDSVWEAGSGLANESLFGRLLKLEADYTSCYQDSDPKFDVRLQWTLSKSQGPTNPSNEFEASISPLSNHPTAAQASQSYAWPAPSTRQLSLNITDLAGSQLESFRAGLFAQARDSYGTYRWRSSTVQASASMDTEHCLLCTREARVSITVDTDSDGDGVSDSADADDDNDGIPDIIETRADSDSDGIANHQDLDSDNDGLLDLIEAGGSNQNLDGRISGGQDADGDGWNDLAQTSLQPERDTDGDGVMDFLDLDSDNDGTPDVVEQGQIDQAPRDGRVDGFRDANGDGVHDSSIGITQAVDSDNDGSPNVRDLNSDNDEAFDAAENELDSYDKNNDGLMDDLVDNNSNGIIDAVDATITGGADTNQNGIDDRYDAAMQLGTDQDNDGVS